MSKELTTIQTAYLALQRPTQDIVSLMKKTLGNDVLTPDKLTRVTVPSGDASFWMIETLEGKKAQETISGIPIFFNDHRAYWPKSMNDGGKAPPDCSSDDAITGYARTDEETGQPLLWAEEGGHISCAMCPFAEWGSGKNGGQACKISRDLYLLPQGEAFPWVVSLSPTSIAPVQKFMMQLLSSLIPPEHIELTLGLEKAESRGKTTYHKVAPKLSRHLNTAEKAQIDGYCNYLIPHLHRVNRSEQEAA